MHELFALLQADWPLQEFTPVQCTVSSAAAAVPTKAVPKSIAAAVATATPETKAAAEAKVAAATVREAETKAAMEAVWNKLTPAQKTAWNAKVAKEKEAKAVKEKVAKAEAADMKKKLEEVGATVEVK